MSVRVGEGGHCEQVDDADTAPCSTCSTRLLCGVHGVCHGDVVIEVDGKAAAGEGEREVSSEIRYEARRELNISIRVCLFVFREMDDDGAS